MFHFKVKFYLTLAKRLLCYFAVSLLPTHSEKSNEQAKESEEKPERKGGSV